MIEYLKYGTKFNIETDSQNEMLPAMSFCHFKTTII